MQERKLMELAEAAGTIAIVGHVRPDGDCVGSCLAVCNYITEQYPEKTVDVYLETPPVKFSYLKQFERICSDPETGKQYDLCICLDSGDRERLGKNVVYLDTAKTSICIDHHITNQGYGAANFVKADASATCELLYDFLDEEKISKEVAECIYTGILHDTNVFKNSNTTERTMQVAGAMMAKGINFSRIIRITAIRTSIIIFNNSCNSAHIFFSIYFSSMFSVHCPYLLQMRTSDILSPARP